MRKTFMKSLAIAGMALALRPVAYACSVCVVADEEARGAYYATTALMSFLPLVLIGAVVLYLFKKKR